MVNFKNLDGLYFIAEIGINHNGDIGITKKLIDASFATSWDCVKFQKRNPDVCVPNHQKDVMRDTPWGRMTYLEYKHKVEFGKEEYDYIDSYCKEKPIDWTVSVWDIDSVNFISDYDVPFIKIPSAMLTNDELIEATIGTKKQIILSTGMSTIEEIDHAVDVLGKSNFTLLHCNSTYPAPEEDLNLNNIKMMQNKYNVPIGYSGHEQDLEACMVAVTLGANIIERHITLDRTMEGSDHACSVTPHGLFKMVSGIRELEKAYGTGVIEVTETEKSVRKKLRG